MQLADIIPRETNVAELRRRRELSPSYHKTKSKVQSMDKTQLEDLIKMIETKQKEKG